MKSIVFKTVGIIGSLQDVFKKLKYIKFVFIYGSFAKNKENYISDIDIMVIGKPDENILIKEINTIEKNLQPEKIATYPSMLASAGSFSLTHFQPTPTELPLADSRTS